MKKLLLFTALCALSACHATTVHNAATRAVNQRRTLPAASTPVSTPPLAPANTTVAQDAPFTDFSRDILHKTGNNLFVRPARFIGRIAMAYPIPAACIAGGLVAIGIWRYFLPYIDKAAENIKFKKQIRQEEINKLVRTNREALFHIKDNRLDLHEELTKIYNDFDFNTPRSQSINLQSQFITITSQILKTFYSVTYQNNTTSVALNNAINEILEKHKDVPLVGNLRVEHFTTTAPVQNIIQAIKDAISVQEFTNLTEDDAHYQMTVEEARALVQAIIKSPEIKKMVHASFYRRPTSQHKEGFGNYLRRSLANTIGCVANKINPDTTEDETPTNGQPTKETTASSQQPKTSQASTVNPVASQSTPTAPAVVEDFTTHTTYNVTQQNQNAIGFKFPSWLTAWLAPKFKLN